MPTRNTGLIRKIVEALGEYVVSPIGAQGQLERHFEDKLLIVAGDTETIDQYAQKLRLAITTPETARVLDYIGEHNLAHITIDTTEEVINALFPNRFIEP